MDSILEFFGLLAIAILIGVPIWIAGIACLLAFSAFVAVPFIGWAADSDWVAAVDKAYDRYLEWALANLRKFWRTR